MTEVTEHAGYMISSHKHLNSFVSSIVSCEFPFEISQEICTEQKWSVKGKLDQRWGSGHHPAVLESPRSSLWEEIRLSVSPGRSQILVFSSLMLSKKNLSSLFVRHQGNLGLCFVFLLLLSFALQMEMRKERRPQHFLPLLSGLSSVQFSHSVVSNSLRLHGLQLARAPCPQPTPRVYSDSCPLSW